MKHRPNPLGRDGEELLPGAASTAEEEGGDDEEASHRFALGVPSRGGRLKVVADPFVSLARVRVRFVVVGVVMLLLLVMQVQVVLMVVLVVLVDERAVMVRGVGMLLRSDRGRGHTARRRAE